MKVPTYTSQSALSGKSGGKMLSVQASPAGFSQVASAFKNFADTTSKVAWSMYEQEVKAKRSSDLAAAQNTYDKQLNEYALASLSNNDPKSIVSNWNSSTKSSMASIANGIEDPVVKRRFMSWATDTTTDKTLGVMKIARSKEIDLGKAHMFERINNLKRTMAEGSQVEKTGASRELFGFSGVGRSGEKITSLGIYDQMASLGYITNTEAVGLKEGAKGDIDELEVRTSLATIGVNEDEQAATDLLNSLLDPKNYSDLPPEVRNSLINTTNTLQDSIISSKISRTRQEQAAAEKLIRSKQREGSQKFWASIEGGKPINPTELLRMYTNDELTEKSYTAYKDFVQSGAWANVDDELLRLELTNDILNAQTDLELENLQERVNSSFEEKLVQGDTAVQLQKEITARLDKTNISKEKKFYGNLVDELKVEVENDSRGYDQLALDALLLSDAKSTYNRIITDPNSNMSPQEAYEYVRDLYVSGIQLKTRDLPLQPQILEFLQDKGLATNSSKDGRILDLEAFTQENWMEVMDHIVSDDIMNGYEKALDLQTLQERWDDWNTLAKRRRTKFSPFGKKTDEDGSIRLLTQEEYNEEKNEKEYRKKLLLNSVQKELGQ